jgi:hypothetical protein
VSANLPHRAWWGVKNLLSMEEEKLR